MNTKIREATEMDYEGLTALFWQVDALHHKALPQTFRAPELIKRSREFIAEIIADDKAALLIAEVKGHPNVQQIQLNVFEFNQRAIAFYEKVGFVVGKRHMWLDIGTDT